jgi:elongation factor Ts
MIVKGSIPKIVKIRTSGKLFMIQSKANIRNITMIKIDKELIQELRDRTGLGMMDCKKALEETNGNIDQAIDLLRKKGASVAAKRAGRTTTEGVVYAYIHPGDRLGVMVEINCETDFVARTAELQQFAKDVSMHIAALRPLYVSSDEVDAQYIEKEKAILKAQLAGSNKPANILETIIQGKLSKVHSEICLLNQQFVKNDQQTVQDALNELIARTGENIVIKRFARFEIGA